MPSGGVVSGRLPTATTNYNMHEVTLYIIYIRILRVLLHFDVLVCSLLVSDLGAHAFLNLIY